MHPPASSSSLRIPARQTFSHWIPLDMVSARGMDIKQFVLFAWLPFLAADLGCVLSGYLSPFLARRSGSRWPTRASPASGSGPCAWSGRA
jgi:hypothetical protein